MRHHRTGIRTAVIALLVMIVAGIAAPHPQALQAQGGGTIGYGSMLFGRITADMPEVLYSFSGAAGDLVEVRARNWVGTVIPRATLFAPDGQPAAASELTPFAVDPQDAYLALFLPQAGVYVLQVGAEPGTTGEFVLTLHGRAPVIATPLAYNQGVDVAIPQNPPLQYFAFDAQDCPTTLTVTNLSDGQPFTFPYAVRVRNSQGRLIALLLGGDAIEDRLLVPARSGRYEVEVWSDDPQAAGTVHLLVSCGDQTPGCVTFSAPAVPGETGATVEDCPPCIGEDPGPCADFAITVTPQEGNTFLFEWTPVEGAEWYIFQILDVWDALLEDSPRILEGETSNTYTVRPEDVGRGPFRVIVLAGPAGPGGGYLCTADAVFTLDEGTETCESLMVAAHIVPGPARAAVVEWSAAPGAGAYLIHIYAYAEDDGLIGIRVLVAPGDTLTYHLSDVFPPDYDRYQIRVDAYAEAIGSGAFGDMPTGYLCSGTTDIQFEPAGPVHWGAIAGS